MQTYTLVIINIDLYLFFYCLKWVHQIIKVWAAHSVTMIDHRVSETMARQVQ